MSSTSAACATSTRSRSSAAGSSDVSEARRAAAAGLARAAPFAREQFARIAEGEVFDGLESFLPWLDADVRLVTDQLGPADRIVLVDPRRMRDRAVEIIDEESALAASLAETWRSAGSPAEFGRADFPALHAGFDRLLATTPARVTSLLATAEGPGTETIRVGGWPQALGDATPLASRIGELSRSGAVVVVAAEGAGSAARISDVLDEAGVTVDRLFETPLGDEALARALRHPGTHVVVASLDRGFVLEASHVAVLAESDLTGRHRPHRVPRPRARPVEGFFDDLAVGSYVVHHVHGVARYGGMVRRGIAGTERDYLLLEYRGGDRLYVPSDQIDTITPYTGGEHPSLNRLNGSEWQRSRARVRQAVRAVAQELVVLYRRRLASPGHAFAPDSPWQAELEQSFPYPETADQLRAVADVKADMERPVPMDRLVCGDVGFGKTEVAVRAAFKAVQDGMQVAVLVPTTILARQHYETIADRFAPYPVRVEMLSRFLTAAEAAAVVRGLADGSVDLVVGTHRLLADDVRFRQLGLLVVDEEQRFGVNQKEAIKKLAIGVDVLTLTANPIPRTLEMGLTGIRDLSVIDTPPAERQPILTYVGEEDDRAVSEAIRRELLREGQVFFVHNRVEGIEAVAARVAALAPEARIAIAHGQMDEGSLERTVVDFTEGRYDVLVCTTIIESGIDMPAVNTLVVDRADLLGLGQLHQLRGRVGRSSSRAYAYLFHPADRVLSEQAYERLRTIGEHTELGSGFKIAMRDLEIRGAGSLLGTDQSGHIAAVGYDLYVRMVAEAVAELKGEEAPPPVEVRLDVPLDAHLPASYVTREDLRLEAYRRLAAVRDQAEVDDIGDEWLDRYGPLPPQAAALLEIARLRAECVRIGATEVTVVAVRPGSVGPGRPGEAVARISPLRLPASARVRPHSARAPGDPERGPPAARRAAGGGLEARRRPRGAPRGARAGGGTGAAAGVIRLAYPPGGPYDRRSVRRISVLLCLALVAALALGACNAQFTPYAARVGGVAVSQSTLDAALDSVAGDPGFRCLVGLVRGVPGRRRRPGDLRRQLRGRRAHAAHPGRRHPRHRGPPRASGWAVRSQAGAQPDRAGNAERARLEVQIRGGEGVLGSCRRLSRRPRPVPVRRRHARRPRRRCPADGGGCHRLRAEPPRLSDPRLRLGDRRRVTGQGGAARDRGQRRGQLRQGGPAELARRLDGGAWRLPRLHPAGDPHSATP